jgi:hypothetical protein
VTNVFSLNPPIRDLFALRPGDRIEARRNGFTHYFGQVELAFPEEETVLIIEGVGGRRKLLHREEYVLHRSTR